MVAVTRQRWSSIVIMLQVYMSALSAEKGEPVQEEEYGLVQEEGTVVGER